MNRLSWTIAKNAISNLVRGGATAVVALALPHYLARALDVDRFAAWSLILQIAAYASFLDFGLQTAVARFIAQAIELADHHRVERLIQTAVMLLCAAAAVAILVIGVVVFYSSSIFHGVPPELVSEFRQSAVLMAFGAALLLPLSTFTGVLVGMHQNELPALAVGGSRLFGAAIAIAAAHFTHSLVILSLCIVLPNFCGGLLQIWWVIARLERGNIFRVRLDRTIAKEFFHYCIGLTVWSFSMLLISGMDVTIVGHYVFGSVGYYAIAATAMSLFASANSTVLNAFLAPFASMQANRQLEKMRSLVIKATKITTLINVAATAIIFTYGKYLLSIWVGVEYATQTYLILVILMIAQCVRLTGSSYSVALVATGLQNRAIPAAVSEAAVNLVVSLIAVQRLGAIGVAVGSLAGAIVSIPALLLVTIEPSSDLTVSRSDFSGRGLLAGILLALPLVGCAGYLSTHKFLLLDSILIWSCSLIATLTLWFAGHRLFPIQEA